MPRLPAIFFGHGNPMNALLDNVYTKAWAGLGVAIPRPAAILCISAHWFVPETGVTLSTAPRTIHDFGGFPAPLYQVQYPAPGDPALARRVQQMLTHVYPKADVPIVQLSIDEREPASFHYEVGKRLAPLRDEGVLIVGSGNLVHNLHAFAWGKHNVEPFDWALRFEQNARDMLVAGEQAPLVEYDRLGRDALLSIPTPDHYLPLLYVIATRQQDDRISFPVEGVDGGSVSMLAVRVG
jgi:4,5-DOPA dioxygenase extradiol